ncbi:hypothetical protein L550_0382 [Bordetella pertussis H973]|uniref:Uncharacterized protein n=1 Tax=Bordetella pertussis CHLA-26 TaxID=1331284 RepID=A0AAI9NFW0_BORPT|nr:hypothetical protein V483_0220 [Bordetella pertussis CHLA-11]ETH00540.1 hypothetical protein L569_0221 [Bordetella pertussis 2250905]ETH05854.1 hypothetical protein L570_0196 [Bordetella pertussis 2356847]ETH12937.1 hypothetical protein L574_0488 [Bordetella pertussis STO1-SEAT-0006]ETH16822.1 hypothetical protein L575_3753 [Bordetella pertussis STO1-SEAT-0007]ETH20818.1 hypothetical protein L563_0209 [Bordetella pertussis CHLA-13]ETH23799.1 hypothetical protein L564_0213 [Bordetella pertu
MIGAPARVPSSGGRRRDPLQAAAGQAGDVVGAAARTRGPAHDTSSTQYRG